VGRGDVFGKVFELAAVEQILANKHELDFFWCKAMGYVGIRFSLLRWSLQGALGAPVAVLFWHDPAGYALTLQGFHQENYTWAREFIIGEGERRSQTIFFPLLKKSAVWKVG